MMRATASSGSGRSTSSYPLTVGRELDVDAVIAGTIQREADRYRITMELVDVRSNRWRWSGKIEEKASDLFRLQDMVAEATLRSLPSGRRATTRARQVRPPAPEAHEAFLKGRYYWSRRTGDDVERAIGELERAVSLDNTYAGRTGQRDQPPEPSLPGTAGRVIQPVSLRPVRRCCSIPTWRRRTRPSASSVSTNDWNWAEGEAAFRRAIRLDPSNGNYYQLLSNLLVATGRFDEAIAQIHEGIKADPASIMVRAVAARQYYLARRYDEALAMSRQTLAIDSGFLPARTTHGVTLSLMMVFHHAGGLRS